MALKIMFAHTSFWSEARHFRYLSTIVDQTLVFRIQVRLYGLGVVYEMYMRRVDVLRSFLLWEERIPILVVFTVLIRFP
jgi:hypothetical protein